MELWLLALIALALVPAVRLFMADGCRRATEHGTEDLTVMVTANGANPNDPPEEDAVVQITGGSVEVHPPSGHPTLAAGVPAGGITSPGRVFEVRDEMFVDTESPYTWTANCTVSYECTDGPRDLLGSGTRSAVHEWPWDATRGSTVNFVLRMDDITREGDTGPAGPDVVRHYRWELAHSS